MVNRSELEQIKKWNRTGEFHRSIQALQEAAAIPADIRSEAGCQEGFDTLYLYVEAQLYSGHAEEAEAHYPALQSLLYTWNGIYSHSYTANYQLNFIRSALDYALGSRLAAVRGFARLMEYGAQLDAQLRAAIYYYFSLMDYEDYNVVDAGEKLHLAKREEGCTPFIAKRLDELEQWIAIREARMEWEQLDRSSSTFQQFGELAGGQESGICELALNAEGSLAAVLYEDGIVRVWHTADGQLQAVINRENGEAVGERPESKVGVARAALCFSPDSSLLAVGSGIGVVDLFHVHSGELEQHWELCTDIQSPHVDGHVHGLYSHVSFSSNGRYAVVIPVAEGDVTPYADGADMSCFHTIFVIEINGGRCVLQHTFREGRIGAVAFSEDERMLAVGVIGQEVAVWELNSGSIVYFDHDFVTVQDHGRMALANTIAFAHGSSMLAYPASDHTIKLISMSEWGGVYTIQRRAIVLEEGVTVSAITFSEDGGTLISAEDHSRWKQGLLSVWDVERAQQLHTAAIERSVASKLAIHEQNDELWVLTGPVLEIRRLSTLEQLKRLDPYQWHNSTAILQNPSALADDRAAGAIAFKGKVRFFG
ncbi:WD40 repeat domain-containing protein [Paenibacillus sp. Leaf72]|uniref:WD40 repeat domain-containing protein n=1 Tax=Paenibacillus sp. Leaf72 TaxID=1736234 RepID=UPI0006FA47E0|nr:hypothetical protein [Paenibacillus sp. Leaf72]KQO10792.1 hypothetical protein ASF12_10405 [Paenibacillus sp. Leaf72]